MPSVSEPFPKPVAAPERSLTQRMEALQRANDVRSRRAQLKRDLKAGRQQIHELLLNLPEYLQSAKVFDLLLAVSATTRDPRPGESDGVDYHFLSPAEFERRVAAGEFVEHAAYSGRRY